MILAPLDLLCDQLLAESDRIAPERKEVLRELSAAIDKALQAHQHSSLLFICTHNSRRSHLCQIWAAVAAAKHGIKRIQSYSGGTEVTALHPNIIATLYEQGLIIKKSEDNTDNPVYNIIFGNDSTERLSGFSKHYHDQRNPQQNFIAITTCTDAESACPFIAGADYRIALPYTDPKHSDGSAHWKTTYKQTSKTIAIEMLWVMHEINQKSNT